MCIRDRIDITTRQNIQLRGLPLEDAADVTLKLHALNQTEAQKQRIIRINIVSVLSPGFKVVAWASGRPGSCAALVIPTK